MELVFLKYSPLLASEDLFPLKVLSACLVTFKFCRVKFISELLFSVVIKNGNMCITLVS